MEEHMIPTFEKAHRLTLTDTEKELLNYFENNLPSSAFISLKELGAKLYTSNATVVRFCQKLGLRGYNEFKYQVRHELEQLKGPAFSSNSLISQSIARFQDNLETVNTATLEAVARMLADERPIYIYGSDLSSLAARYLHTILTMLDHPAILVEWHRLLNGLTYELGHDALLFIITAHGDAQRYLPAFQRAQEHDTCIVLLTCQQDSPLIPYSTYAICTNDQDEEYRHVTINGRLGIFTIIQILVELIASIHQPMQVTADPMP